MAKRIIGYTTESTFQGNVKAMIEHADGLDSIALIIDQNKKEDLKQVLPLCDAIILIGGADWSPTTFGGELLSRCGYSKFDVDRDKRELFVIEWAAENDKKLLGICRGMQGLGIVRGVPLIPNIHGSDVVHNPGAYDIKTNGEPIHFVYIPDRFQDEFGFEKQLSNSFHHQALQYNDRTDYEEQHGIQVLGTATMNFATPKTREERNIEIIRDGAGSFVASQFHLENDWQVNPISAKVLDIFKEMVRES